MRIISAAIEIANLYWRGKSTHLFLAVPKIDEHTWLLFYSDDDEIVLEGEAQTGAAVVTLDDTPTKGSPGNKGKRKGRPRLDPDSDYVP